jgi:hypothetical protein
VSDDLRELDSLAHQLRLTRTLADDGLAYERLVEVLTQAATVLGHRGCGAVDWCDGCGKHVPHGAKAARALSAVSSQDTPPPPRRQWAVQHPSVITTAHNSEWSALYTLSRLPGGVLVTRDHPDQPWRPETECVCVTVPDTGHYAGCPAALPSVSTDPDGRDR